MKTPYTFPLKGFSLVEMLVALVLVGTIAGLSMQAIKPDTTLNMAGRKTANFCDHVAAVYQRIYHQYGVTPLTVDYDENGSPDNNGVPAFLKEFDSVAGYSSASPEYLDYPSGFRVYTAPEQLSFMTGSIHTALNGKGITERERLLVDVDPASAPGGLTNGDVVLLIVDEDTGQVLTGRQFAVQNGLALGNFPVSFYDTYMNQL
jgi:prepilin-type N-terminal cleavage/methylation domain-containing protein